MKNSKLMQAGFAALATAVIVVKLQAQTATVQNDSAAASPEPLVMNASDMAAVSTLSTAELAAFLSALAATPQIAYTNIGNQAGTFYSLQNPEWPPLPFDSARVSVWPMNGFLLLSDLGFDYTAAAQAKSAKLRSGSGLMSADDLTPPGDGDTNGYGSYTNSFTPPVLDTNIL